MKNSLNNKKTKKLSLTVGITTCYGDSILDTVKSIRASKGVDKFRFIIIADRNPIKPQLKKALNKYGIELTENKTESGQVKKQKQILKMTKSEIIVLTQDDILFEPYTLAKIVKSFEADPEITFASVKKQPVKPTSLFEDITIVGTNIVNRIVKDWNNGDNYLSSIGRCLAFRTEWLKQLNIPNEVVSEDAYTYFENKRKGGVYKYISDAVVLYKKTQKMKEHLRKSSRFQHQKKEMSRYFDNLEKDYKIPTPVLLKSILAEFLHNPIKFFLFFFVYLYTRLFRINIAKSLNPVWEVDLSTKKVLTKAKQ